MSRPHFARRVRGRRALTLAFAPRLIIQLSGGCQISPVAPFRLHRPWHFQPAYSLSSASVTHLEAPRRAGFVIEAFARGKSIAQPVAGAELAIREAARSNDVFVDCREAA